MAYQLASFSLCGIAVPSAYFVITSVSLDVVNQIISVSTCIWASAAASAADDPYIPSTNLSYNFSGAGYASALNSTPVAGVDGVIPTDVGDIVLANLYTQLLSHPQASLVLAGATPV